MENTWKMNVWGVRGSIPVPEADYLKYGGNTTCISVDCGGRLVVFDAGSGLGKLGKALSQEGKKRVDILLSHFHIDHCLGLFGFPLMHDPEAEIHFYGDVGCRKKLEILVGSPYWPLCMRDFQARMQIHEVRPGDRFRLDGDNLTEGGLVIHTLRGNHPNRSLLYRLEADGKSIVYALDCELNKDMLPALTKFSQNANLVIWDANFTDNDLDSHPGWGHSSWSQGIALRREANARQMLMTHYSPEYRDSFLEGQERLMQERDTQSRFAWEGMEIII